MSVCDEGWDVDEPCCPCYRRIEERKDGAGECRLRITVVYDDEKDCPHAPILKLLAEAKEVGECVFEEHFPIAGEMWSKYQLWIRR